MNKRITVILVAVVVVLLTAIGIVEIVKHTKKDNTNNEQLDNSSQIGADELHINDDSQTGIEVDFETGSVIGEVGNKNPSSDKTLSGSEVVGEDNIPSNGNNNNTGNNQEGTSNGNSDSSTGNNQNGDSNSNTGDDKPNQTPSDPNQQTMDGWTPFHP